MRSRGLLGEIFVSNAGNKLYIDRRKLYFPPRSVGDACLNAGEQLLLLRSVMGSMRMEER
jgi:hypothetical protein